jgi:hypothetical protein
MYRMSSMAMLSSMIHSTPERSASRAWVVDPTSTSAVTPGVLHVCSAAIAALTPPAAAMWFFSSKTIAARPGRWLLLRRQRLRLGWQFPACFAGSLKAVRSPAMVSRAVLRA